MLFRSEAISRRSLNRRPRQSDAPVRDKDKKRTEDLAGNVLPAGLLVVHDTSRGGEDEVAERTGREELGDPLLNLGELDVEAARVCESATRAL